MMKNSPVKKSQRQVAKQEVIAAHFQGPVPPPEILSGYNNIQEGFADRIVTLAERETAHRHKIEELTVKAQIDGLKREAMEARIGQFLAFFIGITTIVAGSYSAIKGAQWPGALIGTGGVGALVTAFIYGRKGKPKQERVSERKDVQVKENNR